MIVVSEQHISLMFHTSHPYLSYIYHIHVHTAEKIPADANLRGVAHDIIHQAKLDAFMTLMEVKAAKAKWTSKTGCALTGAGMIIALK